MAKIKQTQYAALTHAEEYGIIKKDLYKVLVLNSFYLVLMLVIYFTNKNSHFLDNWFAKVLHF